MTGASIRTRIKRLLSRIREMELEGALVCGHDNLFYLSGHLMGEGNGPALLFLPIRGTPLLLYPEGESALSSIRDFPGESLPYGLSESGAGLAAAARSLQNRISGQLKPPLGIEPSILPAQIAWELGMGSPADWRDIEDTIVKLRTVKNGGEIERMKRAAQVVDAGQARAQELFREGVTEIGLQAACREAMERTAGKPIGCLADVLIGFRTALIGSPGGVAGENGAKREDPAIVDLLPCVDGYYADCTRTLFAGEAPKDRLGVARLLLEVKADLEALLRPGVPAAEIDGMARNRLSREGSFPHHTGHGIGISHFEPPFIREDSEDVLQKGNVITLEPGIYFEHWGARIEDDYLITEDGFEKLTG